MVKIIMKPETLKSLNKAMDILQLFIDFKKEMGLTEITELSGLNKGTVNRILVALKNRGYLKQNGKRGKYFLGAIYLTFYQIVKSKLQLRNIAAPYLIELSRIVDESVVLTSGNGKGEVFNETFYDDLHSNNTLKVIPREGIGFAHETSTGKILLAEMNDEELKIYFSNPKNIIRPYHDLTEIKKQLKTVRRKGVAFDDLEASPDIRDLAAGVRDCDGNLVGVITIVAPSVRFSRAKMRSLVPLIRQYTTKISAELGFKNSN
jgi:IclR family transcriptional regulator, KDG regulon repressor